MGNLSVHAEMIRRFVSIVIYSSHVITPLVNSSLYSYVTYRQVKEMGADQLESLSLITPASSSLLISALPNHGVLMPEYEAF